MEDEENSLDSIVVLPDPIRSPNQATQIHCLNQADFSNTLTNQSTQNSLRIEQENKNLRILLNTLKIENFELKCQLEKLSKRDAFVDVDSACLIDKIEKNLIQANRIFSDEAKLKDSMQYLVKNLWSSIAFSYTDGRLVNLTKARDELMEKLEKNGQKCRVNLDHLGKQMELLHSNNLMLKNKFEEQKKILSSLAELWTNKVPDRRLNFKNVHLNLNYLNFNFNELKQDFVDFLKSEIFDQKKFFREKMIPIVKDRLFFESDNKIMDYVAEFYKHEDLLCKIKHDKLCSHLDLVSKFERIIDRIFSAQDLTECSSNQNSKGEHCQVINSMVKVLIKINLCKFSNQSESIVHNIYSGLLRLFRVTTIFDDESKQELGGDVVDRLVLPVLDSASIIFDIFVMNTYGILNQELNFMTALVLTSAANDMEKHLKSFMSVYINVYRIIHDRVLRKKLKKHQIGPNGENILSYLSYLELLKDLTIVVCSSLTRKFVSYEPDHQLIRNFLLHQTNAPENTWLVRVKKNFFSSSPSDMSLFKCADEEFVDLVFNCVYSLFLASIDFTKKSDVSIAKFAIYHFSASFSPKSFSCSSNKALNDSNSNFSSEVD
ncbi:hypothetical protein BpHYR1_046625 [Brachionus plicatilis]|uniref:Uncharacterized protein n=1 Tax=Brachionus plicatilis TaxID=10195 RepID=A0A3M7Q6Z3_BRAPC|nr:hypothetical protein BpHYR1_046625 [Brachionus plicatilis]